VHTRLLGLTAALVTVAITAGCGLTGSEPNEPSQRSGEITVGDKSRHTQTVACAQTEWLVTITATSDPGRARASLKLDGDKPSVQTVNIENLDGLNGVAGGDLGKADASVKGSVYTITGTATVSDVAKPGQTQNLPFKIEAPC
jgi:ipoprotein LpqH